jgi:hypothetical protein
LVEEKEKKGKGNSRRLCGKHEWKGRGKSKEAHLKHTRKIRKYNKMDVKKENVQNTANEHETK